MKREPLERWREIVPTLEGVLLQLPEEKWVGNEPLYQLRYGGRVQIVTYRRANTLYQCYNVEKHQQ